MNTLETWRTLIVAAVAFLYGVLDKFGVVPEGITITDTSNAIMTLAGLFFALRLITTKKVGSVPPGGAK